MIFIDTGAFLARCLERDEHHKAALAGFESLRRDRTAAVTTCHVLDETLTLLARWVGAAFAADRGRAILSSRAVRVLRPTASDELRALDELVRFADQGVSFTDALSFAVMRRLAISDAFAFDRHFALAGFALWP